MTAPQLRGYQREAIDAVIAARRGGMRRMVVCLPTGAGKTVIFSHLARLANAAGARARASRGAARAGGRQAVARARRDARRRARARQHRARPPTRRCSSRRCARCIPIASAACSPGATSASSSTTSATTHPPRTTCACSARSARSSPTGPARLLGFTATTARGDGKGLDTRVRAHRLLADAAGSDRRGLPRAAEGLPHRDRRGSDAAVAGGRGLRRGGARRGGRHPGAQRARRALDPGARARSPHDRVLRDRRTTRATSRAR